MQPCLAFLVLFLSLNLAQGEYRSYTGYKVVRTTPQDAAKLKALNILRSRATKLEISFWREPSSIGRSVDIMIPESKMGDISSYFLRNGIDSEVVIKDVQILIDEDLKHMSANLFRSFAKGSSSKAFDINQYHSHDEINNYLDSLATENPTWISTFVVGKSHEGRDMKVIKIGTPGTNKKGYWLDAGIHAREWITHSTALYIIDQLVTKYSTDQSIKELVDNIDFYILPSINPDGYEYTRNSDRMWRKTRSGPVRGGGIFGRDCYGADPNRNWPYHWGGSGTSSNACDDTFEGTSAWSEVENKQVGTWLLANAAAINIYVSLHSYAQLFMFPYAYAPATYPDNVDELRTLANAGADAIKAVHGSKFTVGTTADILYAAAGGSFDWAAGVAKIPLSFTLELRPTEASSNGFVLPPSQIQPAGEETWAGLKVLAQHVVQ